METTISFKLDDPEVVVQIIRVLAGDTSKPRKPRKPLTEAEKKALNPDTFHKEMEQLSQSK